MWKSKDGKKPGGGVPGGKAGGKVVEVDEDEDRRGYPLLI